MKIKNGVICAMLVTCSASSFASNGFNWNVDSYYDSRTGKTQYIASVERQDPWGAVTGLAVKCQKYGKKYTVFSYRDDQLAARNLSPRHGQSVDDMAFQFDHVDYTFDAVVDRNVKFIVGKEADNFLSNLIKSREFGYPLELYDGGQTHVDEYMDVRGARRALLAISLMCNMSSNYKDLNNDTEHQRRIEDKSIL